MIINLSQCTADIKKHLAIIGKRMFDNGGKNIFSNITVSSMEEPIFSQYIAVAAQNIAASLAQFVTSYSDTSITVSDDRWESSVSSSVQSAAVSYATLFSVGEYLAMTHPDLAAKYQDNAANAMATIVTAAYHKNPPTSN